MYSASRITVLFSLLVRWTPMPAPATAVVCLAALVLCGLFTATPSSPTPAKLRIGLPAIACIGFLDIVISGTIVAATGRDVMKTLPRSS